MSSFSRNSRTLLATLIFISCAVLGTVSAQTSSAPAAHIQQPDRQKAVQQSGQTDLLRQFNASLETLVAKVSPAVVQVLVTGFGPIEEDDQSKTALVGRQSKVGSGVIVDADGYIITNAHVVSNARSIEVVLTPRNKGNGESGGETATYPAHLVGTHKDTDLALLKIDATGLPFLPLDPKRQTRQGQLVFALGNPDGLGNSVTMGVVSAVDRQPDPSLPMVFIQTDAPINPGNSGGPLIDTEGYVLGINTFILSEGGGSEGIGFAIPSKVVSFVLERLRKFGHVDQSEIGAASEAITPLLAKGLQLTVNSGVIVVDVKPGGPADSAGMKIGDVVLTVDGKDIHSLPQLAGSLYLHPTDQLMTVSVLRGADKLSLQVPVLSHKHDVDRLLDLVDPQANLVRKIGVLATDVDNHILEIIPDLRIKSGVVVVANTAYSRAVYVRLRPGDVIHAINTKPVLNLEGLRKELAAFHAGAAVVLQIERADGMDYVAFEVE